MNISPGLIGLYWLAASLAVATAFHLARRTITRAAHRAGRTACPCGGAHQ